jgi:hypothetical protein
MIGARPLSAFDETAYAPGSRRVCPVSVIPRRSCITDISAYFSVATTRSDASTDELELIRTDFMEREKDARFSN